MTCFNQIDLDSYFWFVTLAFNGGAISLVPDLDSNYTYTMNLQCVALGDM